MVRSFLFAVLLSSSFFSQAQNLQKATFAAGCFWCTEEAFEKVPGVTQAVSGYIGGKAKKPSYEQVSAGSTGHTVAVRVTYDPSKGSYEKLVDVFLLNHVPTVTDRQFVNTGSHDLPRS